MSNAFVIENGKPAKGPLPRWASERPLGSYFGYFENEFGDQWVLVAGNGLVRVAGGPSGWANVRELRPTLEDLDFMENAEFFWPEDLIMNRDERLWLIAGLASASPELRSRLEALDNNGSNPSEVSS